MSNNNESIQFIPNSQNNLMNNDIEKLNQEFVPLRYNYTTAQNNGGIIRRIFPTQIQKAENRHFLEKLEAIHRHEMNMGKAICRAKEEELDMRIAASLAQKSITLDAQTKEIISEVYQNFSEIMRERLKQATNLFIEGVNQAESYPHELAKRKWLEEAERKFIQDCKFIEKLSDDLLKKIYISLNN